MYIYVYIYMYVYIYIHLYIYTYIHIFTLSMEGNASAAASISSSGFEGFIATTAVPATQSPPRSLCCVTYVCLLGESDSAYGEHWTPIDSCACAFACVCEQGVRLWQDMCMHMYVLTCTTACIYIYIYTRMHVESHTHIHTHMYTHTYTHILP